MFTSVCKRLIEASINKLLALEMPSLETTTIFYEINPNDFDAHYEHLDIKRPKNTVCLIAITEGRPQI